MSYKLVAGRMQKGASLELTEDNEILTELMDWSRCLSLGLRNQSVFSTVYASYTEANKKRYESIAKKIADGIKENETCIVILGENHRVQFPADTQIFYVAPPALDETKRWLRDYEAKVQAEQQAEDSPAKETSPQEGG